LTFFYNSYNKDSANQRGQFYWREQKKVKHRILLIFQTTFIVKHKYGQISKALH